MVVYVWPLVIHSCGLFKPENLNVIPNLTFTLPDPLAWMWDLILPYPHGYTCFGGVFRSKVTICRKQSIDTDSKEIY